MEPRDPVQPRPVDGSRARRAAARSGNIVRSPPGSTRTTTAPVRPGPRGRARRPLRLRGRRRVAHPPGRPPTRPMNRVGQPAREAATATLAALPPRRRTMRAGVSVARSGGAWRCTTTSSTRSPMTHSTGLVYTVGGDAASSPASMEPWPRSRAPSSLGRLGCSSRPNDRRPVGSGGAAAGSAACSPTRRPASCCSRLTDEVLRTPTAGRSMRQLRELVDARPPARPAGGSTAPALRLAATGVPARARTGRGGRPPADPGRDARRHHPGRRPGVRPPRRAPATTPASPSTSTSSARRSSATTRPTARLDAAVRPACADPTSTTSR